MCGYNFVGLLEVNIHFFVTEIRGVPIRWTGPLDWTTGLDYWTDPTYNNKRGKV